MISRHPITMLILAGLLLAMTAAANATKHIVNVGNFAFTPAKTHVAPGDTVRWVWSSGFHTTTSDPTSSKSWNSPTLSGSGQFFEVAFTLADGPGSFPYHCSIHPLTMFDTIFVNYPITVHYVGVGDFAFTPANTHINPGDTVIWAWASGLHTTMSDPSSLKSWASPNLAAAGDHFQLVFSAGDGAGPFPYHCDFHPTTMLDTIFANVVPPCTACGDANSTGAVNISDAVFLIAYIFAGGTPPGDCVYPNGKGDANGTGTVNISDAVYLIAYIFAGGPPPHCQ